MKTAKFFANDGNQIDQLPKTCRFTDDDVFVNHIDNIVTLVQKKERWRNLLDSLELFTDDFLAEEFQSLPLEEREGFV